VSKQLQRFVQKIIEPHVRSMRLMVGRVVADLVIDVSGIQTVQASVLAGEIRELERMQEYGFTSVPLSQSAEGVAVFVGGNREHGIILALDDRTFRLKPLLPGQVALYDLAGTFVKLKADSTGEFFTLTELKLGNTITVEGAIKGLTFQGTFNTHSHIGNLGVVTSAPIIPSGPTDLSTTVKIGL
jgi:phage gp45-like